MTNNLPAERQFFEETFNQAIVMRKQSFPERLKIDEYFTNRLAEAQSKQLTLYVRALADFGQLDSKEARGLAFTRLAQTAIALERFRAAHNSYPAALAELTPEFLKEPPTDPFDGQPLHYRKVAEGYQLYSIGPDLKDDLGKREVADKGDLVFAVVKPPRTTASTSP
jgi:hypothetical protein